MKNVDLAEQYFHFYISYSKYIRTKSIYTFILDYFMHFRSSVNIYVKLLSSLKHKRLSFSR